MADLDTICQKIAACISCGSPSNSAFKRLVLDLLCHIAQGEGDTEIVCASTDGRLLLLNTGTQTLTETDGSPIGDGATAVKCDVEYKQIENCFQDITTPTTRYTRVICWSVGNEAEATTIWFDNEGAVLEEAPENIESCDDVVEDFELLCLCDVPVSGAPTPFVRHIVRDSNGTVLVVDTTLDGTTPYVTTGTVTKCFAGTDNIEPTTYNSSAAASTPAGLAEVSFANVGAAAATVNGASIPIGIAVTFTAYYDFKTNVFNRLDAIAYDGTGTTLLISETP